MADIDAAYKWLRDKGVEPADIVLYGQSVGSGPTAYLAAKEHGLAGVILHSPMASGEALLFVLQMPPPCDCAVNGRMEVEV